MKLNIRERLSGQIKDSTVINGIRTAAAWLSFNLTHGFFGHFMTSSDKTDDMYSESVVGFIAGSHPGKRTPVRRMRKRFSVAFEGSLIFSRLSDLPSRILDISTMEFGVFTLVFGVYIIIAAIIKAVIHGGRADFTALAVGVTVMFTGILLSLIRKPVGQTLSDSAITHFLLIDLLGIPKDKINVAHTQHPARFSIPIIFGMLSGVCSYFIGPLNILMILSSVIGVCTVFSLPEVGITSLIALVPFISFFGYPTTILAVGVSLTFISYLIKYLRNKRTLRLGVISVFVLLLALMILLGGIFSVGGRESFRSALVYFVLIQGYILVVNLFHTRDNCYRALKVLAVSSAIVALYGVFQYLVGSLLTNTSGGEMFSFIEGRATSFFDDPDILGEYLIMLFPLMCVFGIYSKGVRKKILWAFAILISLICLIWTWSRVSWLGFVISMILFLIFLSRRTMAVILAGCVCLPVAGTLLPDDIVDKFLSIGRMSDASTYYRVFTWKGVARMLHKVWISGIGVGGAAFEQMYPLFSYVGAESADNAHNFTLQVVSELGISGFVTLAVIVILFAQKCFSLMRSSSGEERMIVSAGFCGIVAMLAAGIFENIWYNYRIFFIFWVLIALTVAYINAVRADGSHIYDNMSPESADTVIKID